MQYCQEALNVTWITGQNWRFEDGKLFYLVSILAIVTFLCWSKKSNGSIHSTRFISPVHLVLDLESLHLIQSLFKKCQKKYKCWLIKCISNKFSMTGSANTCNFFGNEKIFNFKKKLIVIGIFLKPRTSWILH